MFQRNAADRGLPLRLSWDLRGASDARDQPCFCLVCRLNQWTYSFARIEGFGFLRFLPASYSFAFASGWRGCRASSTWYQRGIFNLSAAAKFGSCLKGRFVLRLLQPDCSRGGEEFQQNDILLPFRSTTAWSSGSVRTPEPRVQ